MDKRFPDHGAAEGLTGIHARIHSGATSEETKALQIAAFLDALADVALSVARRIAEQPADDGDSE